MEALERTGPLQELEKLQVEVDLLVQKQAKARVELDAEYLSKCQPIFERRRKIVTGEVEPTNEEVESCSDGEGDNDEDNSGMVGEISGSVKPGKQAKGVPNFWLSVLKNQETTSDFVKKRDEGALEFLEDIRCKKPKGREGFRFEFQFASNPYFYDKLVVKEVYALSLVGPASMVELKETPAIRWKSTEMNLCVRQIVKAVKKTKGKAKGGGSGNGEHSVVKVKPCPSFFSLFSPSTRHARQEKKMTEMDFLSDEDEDMVAAAMVGLDDESRSQVSEQQLDLMAALWNEVVPDAVDLYVDSYGSGERESDATGAYEVVSAAELRLDTLPPAVRRRIRALKHLQKRLQDLRQDKQNSIVALRDDFAVKGGEIYGKRRSIILGKEGLAAISSAEHDLNYGGKKPSWFLGVPRFWLLVLKGCTTTVELVRKRDEAVLSYLVDIRYKRLAEGFTLDFEFLPNPFFTDKVLSKTFFVQQDGEQVTNSEESSVHWREGKNVTTRHVTDEKSGKVHTKPCPSFFHLFSTSHPHLLYSASMGSEFRQHETSTATSLRDIVVLRALEMYHTAAEWDNGDDSDLNGYEEEESSSSSSESEGADDDEGEADAEDEGSKGDGDDFVADENKLKKLAGKKRRKKDEKTVCCGLSKGKLLITLTVLLLSAEAFMLADMLFRSH